MAQFLAKGIDTKKDRHAAVFFEKAKAIAVLLQRS